MTDSDGSEAVTGDDGEVALTDAVMDDAATHCEACQELVVPKP